MDGCRAVARTGKCKHRQAALSGGAGTAAQAVPRPAVDRPPRNRARQCARDTHLILCLPRVICSRLTRRWAGTASASMCGTTTACASEWRRCCPRCDQGLQPCHTSHIITAPLPLHTPHIHTPNINTPHRSRCILFIPSLMRRQVFRSEADLQHRWNVMIGDLRVLADDKAQLTLDADAYVRHFHASTFITRHARLPWALCRSSRRSPAITEGSPPRCWPRQVRCSRILTDRVQVLLKADPRLAHVAKHLGTFTKNKPLATKVLPLTAAGKIRVCAVFCWTG